MHTLQCCLYELSEPEVYQIDIQKNHKIITKKYKKSSASPLNFKLFGSSGQSSKNVLMSSQPYLIYTPRKTCFWSCKLVKPDEQLKGRDY